ncbi:hypothetical protein FQR65_LT04584 [Abscondita terminalis]|nr:hypothetical protein FQR65_LT04584 [Abscondita terminalis]
MDPTHENRLKMLTGSGIFARLRFGCLPNSRQYLYQLLVSNEDLSKCIDMSSKERKKMPYLIKYRFRETYKIERNLLLDGSNEFSSLITTPCEIIIYGVAITPPHKDGFQEACTNVIISVFDEKNNLLSQAVDIIKVISDYEIPHLVNLPSGVKLIALTTYKISVKYVCDAELNRPELLCFYLSSSINTHANSLSIQFDDQLYGGVFNDA